MLIREAAVTDALGIAQVLKLNGRSGEAYQRQFYAKRNWVEREHMANFILPIPYPPASPQA